MSRDWRVLTGPFFCVSLILLGVLLVEGRHHQDGNQVVHRHRHRHETSSRWHHNYPRSWRDDEDYEDADESEDDYNSQLYSRSYLKGYRDRYESRHTRPHYRLNSMKFADRRRKSHYGIRERNHRIRPSRDRTYRKVPWEYDDEANDYYDDYDKVNRYDDDSDENDEFYPIRRNSRKHRLENDEPNEQRGRVESRWDWKSKNSIRKDDRRDRRRKFGYRGISRNRFHDDSNDDDDDDIFRIGKKKSFKLNGTWSDYEESLDDLFDDDEEDDVDDDFDDDYNEYPKDGRISKEGRYSKSDRKYSKDDGRYPKEERKYSHGDGKFSKIDNYFNIKYSNTKYSDTDNKYSDTDGKYSDTDGKYSNTDGKFSSDDADKNNSEEIKEEVKGENLENNDHTDNEELNNDFYENDVKPSLKTYDDIIRRLTSDDPTTPKNEVRRDYRNIEIGRYLKRDAYGNLKYDPKNYTKIDLDFVTISGIDTTTVKPSNIEKKTNVSDSQIDGEIKTKLSEIETTKNSEQDYDYGDNEQDDDPSTQTDGNNADYGDDENEDEDENTLSTSSTTTTTTTVATTTTSTSTTPKPTDMRFFPKSLRSYERSTGAQYNGYQSKNDYPPMSAHSVKKWQTLGSRESIKETRDKYPEFKNNGKSAEVNEALQHAIKVSREGSCQWPRARIVPVRDVYPSTSTTYIPHCAILHRCSDDTGCCRSEALTCVPKHSHRVELYFYNAVTAVGTTGKNAQSCYEACKVSLKNLNKQTNNKLDKCYDSFSYYTDPVLKEIKTAVQTTNLEGSSVVEKLNFYNHTECECRERTELGAKAEKTSETRFARHHPPITPQNLRKSPAKKTCRCPSEFLPKISPDGECQCKCSDSDQNCIRTRRGKVYFSIRDRLCIHNGDCSPPICEFGEYMGRQGKCPRKQEQFNFYSKYQTNQHNGFRS